MTPLVQEAAQVPDHGSVALAGYGGFCMGEMQLALPMTALREVVPCLGLAALPCPAPCVVGGVDLRGVLVPVVDLRIFVGREPGATAGASVIIMVHEAHLLGLLVDGITGIFGHADGSASEARYGDDRPSHHDARAASLYAGSIRRADTGELVSVLSAAAVARLPQVPMTPDPAPPRSAAELATGEPGVPTDTGHMPLMLVRCGRLALAIDALAVHATLSDPTLRDSVLSQGECRGVIDYAGQHIAAVDLSALCGLGRLDPQAPMQAFVIKFESGYVGLLVDAVLDVVNVARSALVPVPAFALPRPRLFRGALPRTIMVPSAVTAAGSAVQAPPPTQFLMLDAAALYAAPELVGLSQTNTPAADSHAAGPAAAATATPEATDGARSSAPLREMITYELFGEEASPIEQVSEILRYDPATAVFDAQGAFIGLMIDRGRSIPVICLRRLAGAEPVPLDETSSVLVVRSEDDWVGFVVPRLRAIEAVQWSPRLPQGGLGDKDTLAQTLASREMALVKADDGARMLRVLDLAHIASDLRHQALAA